MPTIVQTMMGLGFEPRSWSVVSNDYTRASISNCLTLSKSPTVSQSCLEAKWKHLVALHLLGVTFPAWASVSSFVK